MAKMKLALLQEAIDASHLQTVMDSPVRDEISKYMGMSDMGDALNFWKRNTGDLRCSLQWHVCIWR